MRSLSKFMLCLSAVLLLISSALVRAEPPLPHDRAALGALGVRQEICAVATRVFGIDNSTVLPGLKLVGDGFISLIGYQAQGYHLVPVF